MLKLVLFDMDGTLFESYYNWELIKRTLQIEKGSILKNIYKNKTTDKTKLNILESFEKENTLKTKPVKGIEPFLIFLNTLNIKKALITNNNKENTEYLLNKFRFNFDIVITREQYMWKPEPDAFIYVMNKYGFKPAETSSIGDSHYDIRASENAGINDIFIIKSNKMPETGPKNPNTYFSDYFELKKIFRQVFSIPG